MRTALDSFVRAGFLVMIVALGLPCIGAAQEIDVDSLKSDGVEIVVLPGAGYTTFALSALRDNFRSGVNEYQTHNIPIQAQRTFPGNLLLGLDVLASLEDGFAVGVGGSYARTSAYAGYEDYSGTLDLASHVKLLSLQAIVRKEFTIHDRFGLLFEFRPGLGICWLEAEEKIHITYETDLMINNTLVGDGVGFSGEVCAGLIYRLGPVEFFVKGGYRMAKFEGFNVELSRSFGPTQRQMLGFVIDNSGPGMMGGLALKF